jgi:transketolase
MSKGHAASAWYAALANIGAMTKERLFNEFQQSGGTLGVHPKRNSAVGIETSTGSLGQGLGLGCGIALAHKIRGNANRVYVILGDGECNEGSVWESFMLAKRYKLNNLVAIIDRNKLQSYGHDEDVLNLEEMTPRLLSFGWNAIEVDGHNCEEIAEALELARKSDKPTAIIANTIKGKGVSDFEDKVLWHYKWPEVEHYNRGMEELDKNA